MSAKVFCCCFNLKRKEARLSASLFELKREQKTSADIQCLLFCFQSPADPMKRRYICLSNIINHTFYPPSCIQFWTLGDKPSGQPLDIKASSASGGSGSGGGSGISGGSLLLQWSDPDRSQWNGAIQGYRAGWRRMRYFLQTLKFIGF